MTRSSRKQSVLFLCTGNSCRSQMAEGWANFLGKEQWLVRSAGVERHGLNPYAVQVMAESGVDISSHQSKLIDDLDITEFDYVITVCDQAKQQCPIFLTKGQKIHKSFPDPPQLAKSARSEDEVVECYRRVRDDIRSFVEEFLKQKTG